MQKQGLLPDILKTVNTNPNFGIKISDPYGRTLMPFKRKQDIISDSYKDIDACILNFLEQGHDYITIELRKKNGSSSTSTGKKEDIRPIKEDTVVQKEERPGASIPNPAPAPPMNTPQINPMESMLRGLNGGLNAFDMYANAAQLPKVEQQLHTAQSTAQSLKDQCAEQKILLMQKDFEIQILKEKLERTEKDHQKELTEAKKPLVSNERLDQAHSLAPVLLEFFKTTKTPSGLNAPQTQYSELKNRLVQIITDSNFTDMYCQFVLDVLEKSNSNEYYESLMTLNQQFDQPNT